MFSINQIVRGHVSGTFVILAMRTCSGDEGAQVKPVHPVTHQPGRGEFFLPFSALRAL